MYGSTRNDGAGCLVVLIAVALVFVGLVVEVVFRPGWGFWVTTAFPAVAALAILIEMKKGAMEIFTKDGREVTVPPSKRKNVGFKVGRVE